MASTGDNGHETVQVVGPLTTKEPKTRVWARLFGFIEHPFTLGALFLLGGIVGAILFTPAFIVCAICILLGLHRSGAVSEQSGRVQITSYIALAMALAAGGYFLYVGLDSALQRMQTEFARKVSDYITKEAPGKTDKAVPADSSAIRSIPASGPSNNTTTAPVLKSPVSSSPVAVQSSAFSIDVLNFAKRREEVENTLPHVDPNLPQDKGNRPYVQWNGYYNVTKQKFKINYLFRCRNIVQALSARKDLAEDTALLKQLCEQMPQDSDGLKKLSSLSSKIAQETSSAQKAMPEPLKQAFAVAVETKMMVPSPSKDIAGTGLWALNRIGTNCYLRSVDTAMFIRIKNLQSEKIMITAYNVYAMGGELPRIRMDMNEPFMVLKAGVIPRHFQGVIPFQMPAPSGNAGGGFFEVPFKDSDFSGAAAVQAQLLDRQLGEHYIEPSATVRGWAFFEYNRGTFLPVGLTIKISDDLGHDFSYKIPDQPGNPSGDTLQRLLNLGPTVDLSSCTRLPHPAPLP